MQLNLNNFQEEVNLWKTLLRKKDKDIETLQQNNAKLYKENKVLEETCKSLLNEVAEFNSILSSLHVSVSRLEDYEEEKKILSSEIKRLEDYKDNQKKRHKKEIGDLEKEIEKIKLEYKKETETELLQLESKVSAKQESYVNIINEKEKQIVRLEAEILQTKCEKEQDLFKLKVEYEEMINKLKSKLLKSKVSNSIHTDGYFKDDIFRQKYLKLEKESRDEAEQLKAHIKELESQIDTLKQESKTSANLLQEKQNKLDESIEQDSLPVKRIRLGPNDCDDFGNLKNKFMSNSTQLVRPVKKKLFNLDFNYFG